MKGVVQQKGNLYLVCPKIMLPPINRDTPQNMPVLNGGISAGYLYFSLKSEEIGISRLPLYDYYTIYLSISISSIFGRDNINLILTDIYLKKTILK